MRGRIGLLLVLGLTGVLSWAQSAPVLAQGSFADVPSGHPADAVVNELTKQGILNGYPDGTFGGYRAMTRNEFAVAIQRLLFNISMMGPGALVYLDPCNGSDLAALPMAETDDKSVTSFLGVIYGEATDWSVARDPQPDTLWVAVARAK